MQLLFENACLARRTVVCSIRFVTFAGLAITEFPIVTSRAARKESRVFAKFGGNTAWTRETAAPPTEQNKESFNVDSKHQKNGKIL
mmetsp:Transcript_34768/g.79323  ORF Transcript_34768/g.79323 Transcript_34768/m.79323 type:complete len:86 (+) Transcript_34768:595-852(+)